MVDAIVKSVKEKKELSGLPDAFVRKKVAAYLEDHKNIKGKLEENRYNAKSKEYKQAVKEVRASLREIYGVFQQATGRKRQQLLERLAQARSGDERQAIIGRLLSSHQSTRERQEHYEKLYEKLFSHEKPKSILDIGCGLNPLAYRWIPCKPRYACCDIGEEEIAIVRRFFKEEGISGEAWTCDLTDNRERERALAAPADTVLAFKLIDTLESQERNLSKTIIDTLLENGHARRIIASFPLRSISGRSFRTGKEENWFTAFLRARGMEWTRFTMGDEEFYDVRKA